MLADLLCFILNNWRLIFRHRESQIRVSSHILDGNLRGSGLRRQFWSFDGSPGPSTNMADPIVTTLTALRSSRQILNCLHCTIHNTASTCITEHFCVLSQREARQKHTKLRPGTRTAGGVAGAAPRAVGRRDWPETAPPRWNTRPRTQNLIIGL